MVHPHNFLLYYTKLLRGSVDVAQRAWGYLNDSLRLDLCTRYPAETLACAALAMAADDEGLVLPQSPPWTALLCPVAAPGDLDTIAAEIQWLYAIPRLSWLPSLRPDGA